MKKFLSVFALAAACSLIPAVHAQPGARSGPPGGRPVLGGSTAKLFGEQSAFSATMENQVTMSAQNQTVIMPGKLAFDSGKSRFEMDSTQAKGIQIPDQMKELIKSMGMDKTIAISRPDKKVAYIVCPGVQAYAEMPTQDTNAGKPASAFKIKLTELGKEDVDGHACVKNKAVVTDDTGESHEFTVWNAGDMKDFPLKIETTQDENVVTMTFKDVKLGKPDAAQFDPPADFKKYDDVQVMMQTEMMKRMGGGMGAKGMGGPPPSPK